MERAVETNEIVQQAGKKINDTPYGKEPQPANANDGIIVES